MKNTNVFRINRQSIKQDFIKDFAAKEFDLDHYILVSLPRNWASASKFETFKRINVSDYEETIIKFIENPDKISSKHPLLIIIGSAGTGKSSSVRYALSNANVCEGCALFDSCDKNHPARILIDYLELTSEATADLPFDLIKEGKRKREENFWYHLIRILDEVIDDLIDPITEISGFWHWLVGNCKGMHVSKFYRFLYPKKHLFDNPQSNSGELLNLRSKLYSKLTTEELAYYKLYEIAYLRDNQVVNCNLLIFDNIDTLDPFLQVKLIDFAIEAYRLFGCKAIIPMRPHTFSLNRGAGDFIEVIEHWLPAMREVLQKRMAIFYKKGEKEVADSLSLVIDAVLSNSKMRQVFYATSGYSIRFALRNFFNLLISPLIVTHQDEKPLRQLQLDTNVFYQAYFCSEKSDETIYEKNFVNLFSIKRGPRIKQLSTLKLRLLYCVFRKEELRLRDLKEHLLGFGYDEGDILQVLNDFLERRKALIWSSSLAEYGKKTFSKGSKHILTITPMGELYFRELLSHLLYARECIVPIDGRREKRRDRSLKRVIEAAQELADQDMKEIEYFCSEKGLSKYEDYYSEENLSISIIFWRKILPEIVNTSDQLSGFDYDQQYENFIVDRVEKMLFEYRK